MPTPSPLPPSSAPVALVHGTLLTVDGPVIPDGTLVLRGRTIEAMGAGLAPPPGARVIDCTGQFVSPGVIDIHSHMGVYPWPEGNAHGDGNEAVAPFTPRAWAGDGFDAEDPAIPRARAGGVTSVQVLPGSANLVGGRSAVLKLRDSILLDELLFREAPPGIKMAIGENPKRVYGGVEHDADQVQTRMGEYAAFRAKFQAALDYRAARQRKEPPPRDLDLDVLLDVLDGKVRVHLHCYRTHDIQAFLRVADAYTFKVASLQHALEAYKIREVVAAHGAGVATFADWWGFKLEAWDAIPQNAVLCQQAGVVTCIHSDSASHIQRLPLEAAKMMRYGWTEAQALESVTLAPARLLGVEARVGSLAVGKDADVAVWSHHPTDVYTRCMRTFVDGVQVYDREKEGTPDGVR